MKILVTGGAGFIGSHLADALIQEGHTVRVLDNLEQQVHGGKKPDYLNPKAEYLWGDIRDRATLKQALSGIEAIFHLAAKVGIAQSMYEIESYVSSNVLGTSILLETVALERIPIQKLVVASSMSLYGEGAYRCPACGPIAPPLRPGEQLQKQQWQMRCPRCKKEATAEPSTEEKPLSPTSIYAITKRDQEELSLAVGRSYGIPTVALRYFNTYGSRQSLSNPYAGACAIFSSQIKNNRPPLIFEDGEQQRDFTHVSDIIRANLLVLKDSRADNQVFNVGTGNSASILDVAETLIELYGANFKPQITQKARAGDIRHCSADISRIQALGFAPQVSLKAGLKELVAWGKGIDAADRSEQAARELKARGLTE